MPSLPLLPLLALTTLALACTSSSGPSQTYDEHLKAWQAVQPPAYEFEYSMGCFCIGTGVWWRVQVDHGTFVTATRVDPSGPVVRVPRHLTMDSVFAEAKRAIDGPNDSVGITYDANWHHPAAIHVDPRKEVADDERSLLVREVRAVP
ncbi:MAG: DUF6174 domain-containing protein [Gemmatimonadota bacterium]